MFDFRIGNQRRYISERFPFMKIAISNLHKKPVMDINIDLNYRKKTSPFQKNRDEIFNAHYQDWALDKNFPDNWEDLLNMLEDPREIFIFTEKLRKRCLFGWHLKF